MSKEKIIPIFVPNYGCPHMCVFCNQVKITGSNTILPLNEVHETIEKYLTYFNTNEDSCIEIAFYGGSFTAISLDKQIELLKIAQKYKNKKIIQRIRISTRPDAINSTILNNLKLYGVDIIELGVQSLDEEVLLLSERGHTINDVNNSVSLIKEFGFFIGLQMMVGLPGDNYDKSMQTLLKIIDLQPDFIRIYPTLVVKNTKLEELYYLGKYKPLSLEETILICKDLLVISEYYNLPVIRVGLQPTEFIQLGKDIVAGPFHPAIRQLVEEEIYYEIIKEELLNLKTNTNGKTLDISCNNDIINNIVGNKAVNKNKLIKEFNFKNIRFHKSNINDEIIISIGEIYKSICLSEHINKRAVGIINHY